MPDVIYQRFRLMGSFVDENQQNLCDRTALYIICGDQKGGVLQTVLSSLLPEGLQHPGV